MQKRGLSTRGARTLTARKNYDGQGEGNTAAPEAGNCGRPGEKKAAAPTGGINNLTVSRGV